MGLSALGAAAILTIIGYMPMFRYRMSSTERVEELVHLLDALRTLHLDDGLRASRPIGYARTGVVDIAHPSVILTDKIVRTLDPMAEREHSSQEV